MHLRKERTYQMKKTYLPVYVLIILLALGLTSCVNITEWIEFGRNGKGSMKLEVSLSYIKMFESLSEKIPRAHSFQALKDKLANTENISNVDIDFDDESFVYTIAFDFKDIQALNNALTILYLDDETPTFPFFVWEENLVTRNYPQDFQKFFLRNWNTYTDNKWEDSYKESVRIKHDYSFNNSLALVYSPVQTEITGDKNRQSQVYLSLIQLFEEPESQFTFVFE